MPVFTCDVFLWAGCMLSPHQASVWLVLYKIILYLSKEAIQTCFLVLYPNSGFHFIFDACYLYRNTTTGFSVGCVFIDTADLCRKWKCKRFFTLANQKYSIPDTRLNMKLKQQQQQHSASVQPFTWCSNQGC